MSTTAASARPRTRDWAVAVLLVAWFALATAPVFAAATGSVLLGGATMLAYLTAGLALLADPAQRRNGWLCFGVAAFASLLWTDNPHYLRYGTGFLGYSLHFVPAVLVAVLALRYPGTRLTRPHALVVAALAVSMVGLRLVDALVWSPAAAGYPHGIGWVTVVNSPWAEQHLTYPLHRYMSILSILVAMVAVLQRLRSARGVLRHGLLLVVGVCLAAGVLVLAHFATELSPWAHDAVVLDPFTLLAGAAVPVALLGAALRRRTAEAAMTAALAQSDITPAGLRTALRASLLDPTLEVRLRDTRDGGWLTVDGQAAGAEVAAGPDRRRVLVRDRAGEELADVEVDARAVSDERHLAAAVNACRLALENARLHARLLAQMDELAQSRSRLAESAVAQRRRVERDLHDGAQQRLLAVAATLARVDLVHGEEQVRTAVGEARVQLRHALAELRQLARGIHPAELSQGGLSVAMPSLASHSPVALSVDLDGAVRVQRLRPALEATAYFVVAEAVSNVAKHAPGAAARVRLWRAGDNLHVEIRDDGPGTAAVAVGGGLAGLGDRVRALGGQFSLRSEPGSGTGVLAVLPWQARE